MSSLEISFPLPLHTKIVCPTARYYPVDEACEKVVRAFESKNWQVPDIEPYFYDMGTGEEKYRVVNEIKGSDFSIQCDRYQGMLNEEAGWKNEGAVSLIEIVVDGCNKQLSLIGFRVKLAIFSEDRINYRIYSENPFHRKPRALFNDQLEEEKCVSPRSGLSPWRKDSFINTREVFEEFNRFLYGNVLNQIEALEEPSPFPAPPYRIPYPKYVGSFYVLADFEDYMRIAQGKEDPGKLPPKDRYALEMKGKNIFGKDEFEKEMPEEIFEEYQYCSLAPFQAIVSNSFIIKVTPKFAEDIFVIEQRYQEIFNRQRYGMTTAEKDMEYKKTRKKLAKSFIHVIDYKNNYENPAIYIRDGVEFSFDEVEIFEEFV